MANPANPPGPNPDEVEEGPAALAEGLGLAKGVDLSDRQALNRFQQLLRRDAMDGHLHRLLVVALYLIGGTIILLVIALLYNMAAPEGARFLKPDEVKNLQSLLFSGAIGSFITAAAKKLSGKDGEA